MHSGPCQTRELPELSGRPRRLRAAGASLAAVLALGIPLDGANRVSAGDIGTPSLPNLPPGHGPMDGVVPPPSALLGRLPALGADFDESIWSMVFRSCDRFGIAEKAVAMYSVLWEESRLTADAESACGRYHGIGQFSPRTFGWAVDRMRERGLIPPGVKYSPYDPANAIEVMAFMWSEEMEPHWGPYKRVIKRLQREEKAAARTALVARPVN